MAQGRSVERWRLPAHDSYSGAWHSRHAGEPTKRPVGPPMPAGGTAPDEAAGGTGLLEQPAIVRASDIAKTAMRSSIRTGNIPWPARIASPTARFQATKVPRAC